MSSVCFPIALATSLFWHQKSIQVAILVWKIELIFDAALSRKTCSLLTVSCCVTKAMSSSKILSYMFFICWRFVHRTRAGFKLIAEVIQKIPVSSSGSAAVTERKYMAYLLLWSAFQRLAGARARLYHYRFLLPKQHVSSFFKLYRLCVLPRGALSCSLLVCHSAFLTFLLACLSFSACLSFLLLSFWFQCCSFCFLFCCLGYLLQLLAFIGVAWLFLACLGFS